MALKKARYGVPEEKKVRVIIDTDCYCEADDHFAVAHALMSPKIEVKAILAEHYGDLLGPVTVAESAKLSYEEICKLIKLMGVEGEVPILEGSNDRIKDGKYVESLAARFIVEEAMKDDPRPLFVVNQGALTNLASAYLMEPKIAEKLTAISIGGGTYPEGGWEFNFINDTEAVNVIMDSEIEFWQVPVNVYSMMKVSFATLYDRVYPCGEIGKYMVENMIRVNDALLLVDPVDDPTISRAAISAAYPGGESWRVGDSPVVGLILDDHEGHYTMEGAPKIDLETAKYELRPDNTRKIRVYNYIDSHFILEDFFAKIKYYFGTNK